MDKILGLFKSRLDTQSNIKANNAITTSAAVAPSASFMTVRPIEKKPPRKPSPLGPILGGIGTAFSTGTTLGGEDFWSSGDWRN